VKTFLPDILSQKREEVIELKGKTFPNRSLPLVDMAQSLRKKPFITEIKKASPSMGDINTGVDVLAQGRIYEEHGAGAISVLTDRYFFKGDFSILRAVKETVSLPVLCKDFIIDPVQIDAAYSAGADGILLIVAALDDDSLFSLAAYAREKGMEILFEVHTVEEYQRVVECNPVIVGVNNRNLTTFEIDKEYGKEILRGISQEYITVAESGVQSLDDIRFFRDAGAGAFLIGTVLMKSENPGKLLEEFYQGLQ
jgi:indole-3-glycerol phosphate synthase